MPTPSARRAAPVLVAALLVSGCAQDPKAAPATPRPTPITALNTASMQVPRIDFCGLVPKGAVREALGAAPADSTRYGNGDTQPASGVSGQVLHEIGCVWKAEDGTTARAWIFARPVDAALAQLTVDAAGRQTGCRLVDGPDFGSPTLTQQCAMPNAAGAVTRVRHAGLFGQTWLSCEVSGAPGGSAAAVGTRADAWCVEVAESLNTAR